MSKKMEDELARLQQENFVLRETLKYLAKRENRTGGWMETWGPISAANALEVVDDPVRRDLYYRMSVEGLKYGENTED